MTPIPNTLPRPGCMIHYWLDGPENAPLVVLTHGATIDHHEWDATVPILTRAGYRVLTWDLRAHGLSRPAPFDLTAAIDDLIALLDALNIPQAIFVGHSMGGNLHQELVFHHPERVRALVMVDCTWNFQKLTSLESSMLKLAVPIFKIYPYKALVDQSLAATTRDKAGQELLRRSMGTLTKDHFIQIMMATSTCLHYEPDYHVPCPLLLIVGDKDATGNIRKAMPAWAEHDRADLIIVPNALHAPNLDDPVLFHEVLLRFLRQNTSLVDT